MVRSVYTTETIRLSPQRSESIVAEISQDEYERWAAGAEKRLEVKRRRSEREDAREANVGRFRKAMRSAGRALGAAAEDAARGVPVRIDDDTDELVYRGQRESVRGATATVSVAGAVRSRPTITRFVAFGLMPGIPGIAALVAQKKIDGRELFLIIDGPDWQWAVKANPQQTANVHAFAAHINTLSRRLDRR